MKTLLSDQETLQQNLSRSWVLVLLRGLPFGALQQLGEVVKFGCDPIDTQYPSILVYFLRITIWKVCSVHLVV